VYLGRVREREREGEEEREGKGEILTSRPLVKI
jgi:hypothetical protein